MIKIKKTNKLLTYTLILSLLCGFLIPINKAYAEGVSAKLSLVTNRSDLYPGKAFTVTLYMNPNMKVNVEAFNVEIKYDETKIQVIKDGNIPKITPSTKIPKNFKLSKSSPSAGTVIIVGSKDPELLAASGNTPLFTLFFKVKDNAATGTKSNFSITNDAAFYNNASGNELEKINLNFAAQKVVNIGPVQSTDASLESLSPSEGSLTPKFSSNTLKYTLDVPDSVNSVEFTAKAKSTAASFKITGGTSLDYGNNTVTVKVTAQDPDFTKTYSVNINRANIPTVTPEEPSPTEEIQSSIESVSEVILPTPTEEPTIPIIPENPSDSSSWKTIAIIFAILFILSSGVVVWLSIDKVKNRDKMIRIKRV